MVQWRPEYVHKCDKCGIVFINTKLGLFERPQTCNQCRNKKLESLRRRLTTGAQNIEEVIRRWKNLNT